MKKVGIFVLAVVFVLAIAAFSGCSPAATADEAPAPADTSASVETNDSTMDNGEYDPASYDGLLAWYFPLPHPFGQSVKDGVEAYIADTGIDVNVVVGPEYTMASQQENLEAMVSQGYRYFSVFPADAAGANGLYQEMVDKGCVVNNFGVSTNLPTPAWFCVSTDIEQATKDSVVALIDMMGGKGNLIVVLESLTDPATQIRKQAIDETVANYPDITVVQEVSGMDTVNEATSKIGDALAANAGSVDGVICTGFTCSDALCGLMADYNAKNDKKIWTMGIDTDDIILKAIREGNMDSTCAQNPYAIGYISCELMRLEKEGYKPIDGQYSVDSGFVLVTKDNVDTFSEDMQKKTQEILEQLTTEYLTK